MESRDYHLFVRADFHDVRTGMPYSLTLVNSTITLTEQTGTSDWTGYVSKDGRNLKFHMKGISLFSAQPIFHNLRHFLYLLFLLIKFLFKWKINPFLYLIPYRRTIVTIAIVGGTAAYVVNQYMQKKAKKAAKSAKMASQHDDVLAGTNLKGFGSSSATSPKATSPKGGVTSPKKK